MFNTVFSMVATAHSNGARKDTARAHLSEDQQFPTLLVSVHGVLISKRTSLDVDRQACTTDKEQTQFDEDVYGSMTAVRNGAAARIAQQFAERMHARKIVQASAVPGGGLFCRGWSAEDIKQVAVASEVKHLATHRTQLSLVYSVLDTYDATAVVEQYQHSNQDPQITVLATKEQADPFRQLQPPTPTTASADAATATADGPSCLHSKKVNGDGCTILGNELFAATLAIPGYVTASDEPAAVSSTDALSRLLHMHNSSINPDPEKLGMTFHAGKKTWLPPKGCWQDVFKDAQFAFGGDAMHVQVYDHEEQTLTEAPADALLHTADAAPDDDIATASAGKKDATPLKQPLLDVAAGSPSPAAGPVYRLLANRFDTEIPRQAPRATSGQTLGGDPNLRTTADAAEEMDRNSQGTDTTPDNNTKKCCSYC